MLTLAAICALSGALTLAGEVAFVDASAGQGGAVCVMNVEDGAVRQVGPGRHDGPPRWSPDGQWLAFEIASEAGRGLHVVRADGTGGRDVGTGAWRTAPAWSTDGARLVYCSSAQRGMPGQARILDLNTNEEAPWGNGAAGIVQPLWMPYTKLMLALDPEQSLEVPGVDMQRLREEARMGTKQLGDEVAPEAILGVRLAPDASGDRPAVSTEIVLVSKTEVLPLLAVADAQRAASGAVIWGVTPNWTKYRHAFDSPTGKTFGTCPLDKVGETTRIAFESNEGGDREIMVLGKRGVANISNHRAADWNPVWSPNGNNLAFESFRDGVRGVYNVYVDTAHVTPIAVEAGAACWSPAWSPDGEMVVYVSDASGQAELYAGQPLEPDRVQLTSTGGPKAAPVWRPVHP